MDGPQPSAGPLKPQEKYKIIFDVVARKAKAFDAEEGGLVAESTDHKEIQSFMWCFFAHILMTDGEYHPFWWKSDVTVLEFVPPVEAVQLKRPAASRPVEDAQDGGRDEQHPGVAKRPAKVLKSSEYDRAYSAAYHKVRNTLLKKGVAPEVAKTKAQKAGKEATKDMAR